MITKRPLSLLLAVLVVAFGATLVLSAQEEQISFDHGFHAEAAGTDCEMCHAGTMEAKVAAMPGHDECGMCHTEVEEDCGYCHLNMDELAPIEVERSFEDFAHTSHEGEECSACHGEIATVGDAPEAMALLDCQLCHQTMHEAPRDHETGMWHEDHGIEASLVSTDCAVCHMQSDCDDCHQGTAVYGSGFSPHSPTWIHEHAVDASFGGECTVCHVSTRECTSCHRSMVPVPHGFGPDFANRQDGGTHAEDARAWPETCVVCHDMSGMDPTCANCHQ
jgi:hypothetical protein